MGKIKINKEQAKTFAWAIFADIEDYVNEHQAEYQEFLKNENSEN